MKIGSLDRQMRDWQEVTDRKVHTLTERIAEYASYIEEDRRQQELSNDQQLKELKAIELLVIEKL